MRTRRGAMMKCVFAATVATSVCRNAQAYDVDGRVMAGALRGTERHSEASAGSVSNDHALFLGRFYLDLTGIGPYRHQLTIDVRDRYDSFGSLDGERQVLVASNQPEVRELAVRYPFEEGPFFWSVGRFPVTDASVVGNDGFELGFKTSAKMRIGAFAGLVPKHDDQKTSALQDTHRQAGLYLVSQDQGQGWTRYTSLTQALVVENEKFEHTPPATSDVTDVTDDAAIDSSAPAVDIEPAYKVENRAYWYSNNIIQTSNFRLTAIGHVYFAPEAALRNLWVDAHRNLGSKHKLGLNLLHLDLTWYERTRELRDVLAPSVYDQLRLDYRFKVNDSLAWETFARFGLRSTDQLSRTEVAAGLVRSRLASDRLNVTARIGFRKNFRSRDQYLRAGVRYYLRNVELSADQTIMIEQKDEGRSLHPLITSASISSVVASSVIIAGSIEYARDEDVTLASGLLTATYRFNSKQLTQMRDRSLPIERL